MKVKNQVQLITYPDSLGGDLQKLDFVIENYFPGLFTGGIHILPPFPSSGDRGFAPLTYLEIEPQFGSWEDIKQIGKKHAILLDLMVNHISAQSCYFQDYLEKGRKSKYSDLFITMDKIWPVGTPPRQEIDKIFLRRTEPFSDFTIKKTGKVERVWTTFGKTTPSEQIDLDINSPIARQLLVEFMINFRDNHVKIIRLDAVGYVIKKIGTTCFFVEPDIYQFLDWISELAHSLDIEILPEIHANYATQTKLAENGYWIYDFILPFTILDALLNKTSKRLKEYLRVRPYKQFTMLDCHDGIPIKPDLNGFYQSHEARRVVDICLNRGANLSLIFSPKHKDPDGFDVHQIRGTYYSLLGCDDFTYLIARAIQFFTPGVPQVYYVGLLAGNNDEEGFRRTGDGREINRHNYTLEEIGLEVGRPVVKKLMKLIRFRNTCPAFNGTFKLKDSSDHELSIIWDNGKDKAKLDVDLRENSFAVRYMDEQSGKMETL